MVFRELVAEEDVFHQGQEAVGDILVERHPPLQRADPEDPGGEHRVEFAVGDHGGHGRDQLGRVLVVRVEHDDDVRAELQRRR